MAVRPKMLPREPESFCGGTSRSTKKSFAGQGRICVHISETGELSKFHIAARLSVRAVSNSRAGVDEWALANITIG